jgi:proline iminopeptidase
MGYDRPVLIIQGANDIVPRNIAEKGHETFSNSKVVFLKKCGHYGWLEQQRSYLRQVDNFLDKCRCD